MIFSLSFHLILLLVLFSMADRNQREREGFAVEQDGTLDVVVTLHPAESTSSAVIDDSVHPLDVIPPRPAFPIGPEAASSSFQNDSQQPDPSPIHEEEEGESAALVAAPGGRSIPWATFSRLSPFSQEEEKSASPEEPTGSSGPALPAGGMGEFLEEGEGVGDGFPGGGASPMSDGAALPGAIGGGRIAPRFVIPRPGGRSNPKPRYPESARFEGREGTVLLKVTVLPTGEVGEAVTERSSGHADLDRSAVEAVKKWTFSPARRGERPVIASVRIPVTFALDPP